MKKICVDLNLNTFCFLVTWPSQFFLLSPPCVYASLSPYHPACSNYDSLTFLWRWSSNRWGHSPTESSEHANRADEWLIQVSVAGAIDRGTMQYLPTCNCAGLNCFFWQYAWKKNNLFNTPLIILLKADYLGSSFRFAFMTVPTHAAIQIRFSDTCLTGLSRPRCCHRPPQPSRGCWATCCACGSFSAGCGVPGRWWGGFPY